MRSTNSDLVSLRVVDLVDETPDVRTFRFDNSTPRLPLDFPGRFAKVRVEIDGEFIWRTFSISSSPTNTRTIDLTVQRVPGGTVTSHLFEHATVGTHVSLAGPRGRCYFDPEVHTEPLALVSAGIGITPLMSIARFLDATDSPLPCAFLHGARSRAEILFHAECLRLATKRDSFRYHVTLSQPDDGWVGADGRLDVESVHRHVPDVTSRRWFLCGPGPFNEDLRTHLLDEGVSKNRIHVEQFQASSKLVTA